MLFARSYLKTIRTLLVSVWVNYSLDLRHLLIIYVPLVVYDPASKALTPDHESFMVEDEMRMMVGDEYMVIEDGKRVG